MYVVRKDNMIFVYRNVDNFLSANEKNMDMMFADYTIKAMDCNFKHGVVIKDRTALFSENRQLPIKTLLKLIEVLYED